MSSCLSGGGRAYRSDLEIIKSPTTSWISNSSSPSSSLSESTNSPLAISTRKPRTPRKRPNQTYNEAASILSTAHPKIFPSKHLKIPCKLTKPSFEIESRFLLEPSELLIRPFQVIDSSGFFLPIFEKPRFLTRPKSAEKSCQSPGESDSARSSLQICDDSHQDFDAEAILDEDIEEGIDSIMGNLIMKNESTTDTNHEKTMPIKTFCYGYPIGLGFDYGFGVRRESRAMRNVDEEDDWWRFPSVVDINLAKNRIEKKKKMEIKNLESSKENAASNILPNQENSTCKTAQGESIPQPNARLFLNLNHYSILDAWSDKDSPFSGDSPVSNTAGNDVQAKLALDNLEVPVGCVIVEDQAVIASGRNRPTETRNATRHAEMEAIDKLLEQWQKSGLTRGEISLKLSQCTLYVTCEPCIMCAAALSIIGIKEVYYGCANDKFGGCGSIFSLHTCSSGKHTSDEGSKRKEFKCTGGVMALEAINLLKSFYEQGNPNAPKPHRKLMQLQD